MLMRRHGLKDGCILTPLAECQKPEPGVELGLSSVALKREVERWPDANGSRRSLLLPVHFFVLSFDEGRGGEMADATDLKSVDRKVVWVRLPPSAPIFSII